MSKSGRNEPASKAAKGEVAVVLAWFRREEWPQLLANSADREKLEDTYFSGTGNARCNWSIACWTVGSV